MYVIDVEGGLWRMDLQHGASPASLARAHLVARLGGTGQRFHSTPDVSAIREAGKFLVAISVGSGWVARPRDASITDRIYSIRDREPPGAALSESVDDLVSAWRHGDTATLEAGLLDSMGEQEALMAALVTDRNRRWAKTIATWLDDDRDYLVVVGALHLIGNDGVPALLEEAGYGIQQLRETAGVR